MSRARERKVMACPGAGGRCCPDGGAVFRKEGDYVEGPNGEHRWRPCWVCQNCGHRVPVGPRRASRKAAERALARARMAVEQSGSDAFPTEVTDFRVEWHAGGGASCVVSARQGGEGNLLSMLSSRTLAFNVSPMGAVSLYYDSKGKRNKGYVEAALRGRWRLVW